MKLPMRLRAALSILRGKRPSGLSGVNDSTGWMHLWSSGTGEWNPGDWQKDIHPPVDTSLAFFAAYTCVTRPASDVAKLCLRLMERQDNGIWVEGENPSYSPFLRKPNHFQTTQQFVESWLLSKLSRGNTYALKERDDRNVVVRQYVLDPDRVTPLVAPDGSVFYELRQDDLSHVPFDLPAVPASEMIHDRMNCLFHPLVGVSPLYSCGLAARHGLEIQKNAAAFFENMSRPSGVLLGPTKISDETAKRLKDQWEGNFGRGKIGRVAVLGDNLKYEAMAVTPVDAQLVEQLEISAKQICAAFGVPLFMVTGEAKTTENTQALWQIYYSQCLQTLIEAFERLQDDGLNLKPQKWRTEFDLDDLLRMDSKTLAEVEGVKVQRGIAAPNESRRKFNLPPATGGEQPYLQQQNYSLEALAKRDAQDDPFKTNTPAPPAANDDSAERAEATARELMQRFTDLTDRFTQTHADQQRQIDAERAAREAETARRQAELDAQRDAELISKAMAEEVDGYIAQAAR